MHRLAITVAASVLAATASAQVIVVPNGSAATEGGATTAYAWGRGNQQIRVQYVYDSTHFTNQGITAPIVITQLRWRANGAATTAGYTYNNATVQLSSAAVDHLAPSATFASNHGPDLATVYAGPVTVATGAGTTPNNWYVTLPVTPFLYDPTGGTDFCLDMSHDGVGPPGTAGPAHDCVTTGSLVSRIFNLTNYLSPTGTTQQAVAVVMEITFAPATGIFANFSANVTGGASPLNVQFTDSSSSSAPGGVTSWAWDFNGDSVIDSNVQNPLHTYTTCGTYTVSLTVGDGVHPPATLTRTNYIDTDVVTPGFTVAPISGSTFQFTDTSTPTPTSWAWDFDGDLVTDSTAQNPTWTFGSSCGAQTVQLTVSRLCKGPYTTTQTALLSPNTFTTLLSGGTGLAAVGSGNTFDIQVTNPAGIAICSLEVTPYMSTPVLGTPLTCTVWITANAGGYLANHTNAAVWRQVATGTGTYAGGTLAAPVPVLMSLSNRIYVPFGNYAMAVHMTAGSGIAYTIVAAPSLYPGPDFNIVTGNAKSAPFNAAANAGRAWNGRIHYSTPTSGGLAGYGFFGAGCAGTLGISHALNSTQPVVGGTLSTTVDNLEFGVAVMVLGLSNTVFGAIPLPLDLTGLGAPGCPLRVSLDATVAVVGGPSAPWNFSIPNVATLLGMQLYNQAAPLSSINAFGFVVSDAYAWVIGSS